MSPLQPSKRRRLNTASHTLSQPFKSPFKTPLKPKAPSQTDLLTPTSSPQKADPPAPPSESRTTTTPTKPLSSPPPSPHGHPKPAPTKTPTPRHPPSSTSTSTSPSTPTPPTPSPHDLPTLAKQHTHLLNLFSQKKADLETSTQALRLESTNRSTELASLTTKWRKASQAAAEEVFSKARDRVNKMGGVGALRERESRKGSGWGWNDVDANNGGNGGVDGAEGEGRDEREDGDGEDGTGFTNRDYEREGYDTRDSIAKAEGRENPATGDLDEEGGYTMDLMLRSLNIDLEIIGFDKEAQRWID